MKRKEETKQTEEEGVKKPKIELKEIKLDTLRVVSLEQQSADLGVKISVELLHEREAKLAPICLTVNNKVLSLGAPLGKGDFGIVYKIQDDDSKVVKIIRRDVDWWSTDDSHKTLDYWKTVVTQEATAGKLAGQLGLGPQVHDAWLVATESEFNWLCFILMDFLPASRSLGGSEEPETDQLQTAFVEQLGQFVTKLHKLFQLGWKYRDLSLENIRLQDSTMRLWLIDYGQCAPLDKYDLQTLRNDNLDRHEIQVLIERKWLDVQDFPYGMMEAEAQSLQSVLQFVEMIFPDWETWSTSSLLQIKSSTTACQRGSRQSGQRVTPQSILNAAECGTLLHFGHIMSFDFRHHRIWVKPRIWNNPKWKRTVQTFMNEFRLKLIGGEYDREFFNKSSIV